MTREAPSHCLGSLQRGARCAARACCCPDGGGAALPRTARRAGGRARRYAWYKLFNLAKSYNKNLGAADVQMMASRRAAPAGPLPGGARRARVAQVGVPRLRQARNWCLMRNYLCAANWRRARVDLVRVCSRLVGSQQCGMFATRRPCAARSVLLAALSILPYSAVDAARSEAEAELEKDRSMRVANLLGFSVVRPRRRLELLQCGF